MKKNKFGFLIIGIMFLLCLSGCINNNQTKPKKLKFSTITNDSAKINEQEIVLSNEDYNLFYEIVDSLNWERKAELSTELFEYELSSVRNLEEDEGKLMNQKFKKFSCLYKISTISKYVILECMPVEIDVSIKTVVFASLDDEKLEKINAIFDNYQVLTSNFEFGNSSVNCLKYNQTYYQTDNDSFLDIVDKIKWVDVPMNDMTSDKAIVIGMTDTFLVQTSRDLYKLNDENFRPATYSVEYIIDLNTNYAQMFILTPIYVSAIYITAIFEADISEYVDEFYDYFKMETPLHKVKVNNDLNIDYSLSKKYAFFNEEITLYVTFPLGFDESTQKIIMYVNDVKYEINNAIKNYCKFKMLDSDVTIRFEIVDKKIENLTIKYYNEFVLDRKLQYLIIDAYLQMFDLASLKLNLSCDELEIAIVKCYGIYKYNDINVIPVFIESNFIPLNDGGWTEKINSFNIEYQNSNRIYVYYNGEMLTLTDAYRKSLVNYKTICKVVQLEKQQNIKDLTLIDIDESLISNSNKMNSKGGKVIRSVDEFNEYTKENDIITDVTKSKQKNTYNEYLNEEFFKSKSLVIIPYYVQNKYDEVKLFQQMGYYLYDNVMYLDLLLDYVKVSFDIAYNVIPYTKYITIEVKKNRCL